MNMINEITHNTKNDLTLITIESDKCSTSHTIKSFFTELSEFIKLNKLSGYCKIHVKSVSGYVSRPAIICDLWYKNEGNHDKKYGGISKEEFISELSKYNILYKLERYSDNPIEISYGFREFMILA